MLRIIVKCYLNVEVEEFEALWLSFINTHYLFFEAVTLVVYGATAQKGMGLVVQMLDGSWLIKGSGVCSVGSAVRNWCCNMGNAGCP